jgi:hypothetical protein
MSGRSRATWIVLVGGPFDGERSVLTSANANGVVFRYTPSDARGKRIPHEYTVTTERRKGGIYEAVARGAHLWSGTFSPWR